MSKKEFMEALEVLLGELPKEEREEAINYYDTYFADAGEENEQQVLEELGSAGKVAEQILKGFRKEYEDGLYTEHGYQAEEEEKEVPARRPGDSAEDFDKEETDSWQAGMGSSGESGGIGNTSGESGGMGNKSSDNGGIGNRDAGYGGTAGSTGYAAGTNDGADGYGTASRTATTDGSGIHITKRRMSNESSFLLVMLVIITAPVWGSLLIGAGAAVFGVLAAVSGVLFGFGVAGVACIFAGIVCLIIGIVKLFSVPIVGLVLITIGLIIAGTGFLFLALTALCAQLFVWICRAVGTLIRRLFRKKKESGVEYR